MSDDLLPERFIREVWHARHNRFMRVQIWNAIFEARRRRIRQVARYPYNLRCTVYVDYSIRVNRHRV